MPAVINTLCILGLLLLIIVPLLPINLLNQELIILHIIVSMISIFKWNLNIIVYLLSLFVILMIILLVDNIFWFYYGFELLLLPIYLIVYNCGYTSDKKQSGILFIYFALISSLLWLISIISIYSTGIQNLIDPIVLIILFLLPILVKVPIIPFHLWLNQVHTGSPLPGSILLAGIILKVSIYAYLVFIGYTFTGYYNNINEILIIISVISVIMSAYSTIRQIDYKRLIAYSSVNHMNIILFGVILNNKAAIYASILFCIAHGVISAILFIQANIISENINTRNLLLFRGLVYMAPILTLFALFSHLANIGFPPTISWFSELLIFGFNINFVYYTTYLIGFSIIISIFYSIWSFYRIYFGILNNHSFNCIFISEFILNLIAVFISFASVLFFII